MHTFSNLNDLLIRLRNVKRVGNNKYMASCPCVSAHAHNDTHQSLSVSYDESSGKILLNCFTGCSIDSICEAIGCDFSDLTIKNDVQKQYDLAQYYGQQHSLKLVKIYSYCYGSYQDGLAKIRYIDTNENKTFRWICKDNNKESGYQFNRGNCPHRLYVRGDISNKIIILVEGEKDVDNLHTATGMTVVCAENGAASGSCTGKWFDEYTQQLKDKTVFIIGDNDPVGKDFVQTEARSLYRTSTVYPIDIAKLWPECPAKGDVSDMIDIKGIDETQNILRERMNSIISAGTAWSPDTSADLDTVSSTPMIKSIDYTQVIIKGTDYQFFPWFPRGKLTIVQGDTCSSKSTFMYGIGALVSVGADLLGIPCGDPGDVLFITREDDESDILTAFQDAGGDIRKLHSLKSEDVELIDFEEEGIHYIRQLIEDYHLKMVVFDPIQDFVRNDMSRMDVSRPRMSRLMSLAREYNIAIVLIQHLNKDSSKSALHRGVGSVDFAACSRSMLQIVEDPEDSYFRIAFTVKNNTAALEDVRQAIRFQVADHPYDNSTHEHLHFHGHAVFVEILPDYCEKNYKRSLHKAEEVSLSSEIDYANDPLVLTVRKLIEYNPEGLYIGADDLIGRIKELCGYCPYEQTQSKKNGLNSRILLLRDRMIRQHSIQMDIQKGPTPTKSYRWSDETVCPTKPKERGVYIHPVRDGPKTSL